MTIMTVGIDLAKNVFSVHGVDENGKVALKRTLRRDQLVELFANLPSCVIAGLLWRAPLGAPVRSLGAYPRTDRCQVRRALPDGRQARQERCSGCAHHLRSGHRSEDAFRPHQNPRSAGHTLRASGASGFHRGAHRDHQSCARTTLRVRCPDGHEQRGHPGLHRRGSGG